MIDVAYVADITAAIDGGPDIWDQRYWDANPDAVEYVRPRFPDERWPYVVVTRYSNGTFRRREFEGNGYSGYGRTRGTTQNSEDDE